MMRCEKCLHNVLQQDSLGHRCTKCGHRQGTLEQPGVMVSPLYARVNVTAVGRDFDGEFKPLDKLSYAEAKNLADETMSRCYRVVADQPPPQPSEHPAAWDLLIADLQRWRYSGRLLAECRERDRIGTERYGTRLRPHDGRDSVVDALQEVLDAMVYLRKAVYEHGDTAAGGTCSGLAAQLTTVAQHLVTLLQERR